MSWLQKLLPPRIKAATGVARKTMPEGLWVKCASCEAVLYRTDLESNIHVCPKCDHHMRIRARDRLDSLLDAGGRYEIGQEAFRAGAVVDTALKNLAEVGKELEAKIVVFVSPADLTASRPNKAAVKEFLQIVRKKFDRVIWEPPPTWDPDEAEDLTEPAKAIAARDPLLHGLSKKSVAYYRMPGPAGHKSRYEDPAIEKLGELARNATHDDVTYVFANVDMFADAKRFRKAAKL